MKLTMLRAKNIEVVWAEYFRVGWRLTLPVLLANFTALAVLNAKTRQAKLSTWDTP
ncbi:hypothetical protein [Deinococcus detaillensis]|nr:hypothetical protein [Deinococcus detaillensis]